ncbi:MAG: DbpA RNA binding domain-containing protein, partial [Flavobacterium sp.]|nr:DbpA RNA binding domain-containing protein [Flavobacterium sp.]
GKRSEGQSFAGRGSENFSRFYLNLGSKNKLNPTSLIGLINETLKERNIEIGKIEILRNFSFFEIDKRVESQILKEFNKISFDGVKIVLDKSSAKQNAERPERSERSSENRSGKSYGEKSEYKGKKSSGSSRFGGGSKSNSDSGSGKKWNKDSSKPKSSRY